MIRIAIAAALALAAAAPAEAGWVNGTELNGIKYNGIRQNGIRWNGTTAGQATSLPMPGGITLRDGTVLRPAAR